jgi:hypothetical protein
MGFLGWFAALAAIAIWFGYRQTCNELSAAYKAIAAVQDDVAKLGYLWALEIKKRRSLQNESDGPSETVEMECRNRFLAQPDPWWLSEHFAFEEAKGGPVNRIGLQHDPKSWSKSLIPMILKIAANKVDGAIN